MRRVHLVLLVAAALAACQPQPPKPTTPDQLACADPAAPSRVNFRLTVDREEATPYPGADLFDSPFYPGPPKLTVRRAVAISGRNIVRVDPGFDPVGEPTINVLLSLDGAKRLADVSRAAREGERLAIIMDNKLVAAPSFGEPIPGGTMTIHMALPPKENEALAEALELAAKGCAPAPVKTPSPPLRRPA